MAVISFVNHKLYKGPYAVYHEGSKIAFGLRNTKENFINL